MPDDPILDFGEPRIPADQQPTQSTVQVVEDGPRDEALTSQVRERLQQHSMVDASRINVQVVNGTAYLLGTADNRYIRERAETLAREVEGVSDVDNKISIQPPAEEPGPILTTHEPGANNSGSTQRS
jgi:hypothetical protein